MPLVERARANMPEGAVEYGWGKYFITFSERTPDWEIIPGFMLHEFLTSYPHDKLTRIDLKLVLFTDWVQREFKGEITVRDTYVREEYCNIKDPRERWLHTMGFAIDLVPTKMGPRAIKELHKAARRTHLHGGVRCHKNHLHLDTVEKSRWTEERRPRSRPKGVKWFEWTERD